jgi:hypothetical protein
MSYNSLHKCLFFAFFVCLLGLQCSSPTSPNAVKVLDKAIATDTASSQGVANSVKKEGTLPLVSCETVLKNKAGDLQEIYADTLHYGNQTLLFVTRDSALLMYNQKGTECAFLLKVPIDSTDLYGYTGGSPLFLQDMDGDNQKEVMITVEKINGHDQFRVYRLVEHQGQIGLKKIQKFEQLIDPRYDGTTGLVRSHWYDRDDYELDEYYRLSKDDALVFVKGYELKKGVEKRYLTKKGW